MENKADITTQGSVEQNVASEGVATGTFNGSKVDESKYEDYKALYQAVMAEKEKLNQKANGLSKENAELRKKEKEREEAEKNKLPIDEKYRLEVEEQKKINAELKDKINRSEIENIFISNGVEEKFFSDIVSNIFNEADNTDVYEKRISLVQSIVAAFSSIKAKTAENEKNKSIVSNTIRPSSYRGELGFSFKSYQEQQQNKVSSKRVELK